MKFNYTKALITYMGILIISLLIADVFITSKQRQLIYDNTRYHAMHELELLSVQIKDSLIREKLTATNDILKRWGQGAIEVSAIVLKSPNGSILTQYKEEGFLDNFFTLSMDIKHEGKTLATLILTGNHSSDDRTITFLNYSIISGSILFVILVGIAIWFALGRTTITPLENEIHLKDKTAATLKDARDLMEQRIRERTEELSFTNSKLKDEINERQETEDRLKRSELSYRTLTDNLQGAVYRAYLSPDISTQFFNNYITHLTGYSCSELTGGIICSVESIVHPEDKENVLNTIKNSMQSGEPFELKYRIKHKDGSIRYLLEKGQVSPTEGRFGKFIDGVIIDVTESMIADMKIHALNSTLDTLVNHMPEGVVLLDTDDRIVLANPVATDYLKLLNISWIDNAISSIAGRPLVDLIISEDKTWHEIKVEDVLGDTSIYVIAAKIVVVEGSNTGKVLVIKDITQEKAISHRAHEQEKLAAVGQLAAGIAHDFSNILTCIIGFSEMLMLEEEKESSLKQISAIHESGLRASELIMQIMDFSRSGIGQLKPVDLKVQVKEFISFINRIIPENIRIIMTSTIEDLNILADPTKLQQVLTNLAVNSRDAMPKGGTLTFTLKHIEIKESVPVPMAEMSIGKWVQLEVSDTGEGMETEVLNHIYDPFFTTKEQGKGTGLGLAQVYGIIKQHKGLIDVKSTEGKGTTFTIVFPSVDEVAPIREQCCLTSAPKGEGQNILIVEDDPAVRNLVSRILDDLNYTTMVAANGKEALDVFKVKRDEIDLVLTDMVMPEMDGMQMSKEMKKIKQDVKIVVLSGYPEGSPSVTYGNTMPAETGIIKWLTKPFKSDELGADIHKILNNGKC